MSRYILKYMQQSVAYCNLISMERKIDKTQLNLHTATIIIRVI